MQRRSLTNLWWFSGFALLCSCGIPASQNPTGQQQQAIIGGQPSSQFEAIGALTIGGSPFCTATLIASQLVLTASHCVDGANQQGGASSVKFRIDNANGQPVQNIGVQQMIKHPNYVANSGSMSDNDIAVVILSQKVTNVTPIPVSQTAMTSATVGQTVRKIGYGYTQTRPQAIYPNRKYGTDIPIYQVGQKAFIHWDRQTQKSACHGDSGGPALMQINGQWMVVGVTSRGHQITSNPTGRPPSFCDGGTVDCRTDTQYQGFLLQYINQYGGVPSECSAGQTRPCYTGATGTQNVGACKGGTQACTNGKWDTCQGQVLPAPQEDCNDQLDNNCDGQVNEGCAECQPNQTKPCYSGPQGTQGIGQCLAGVQQCIGGKWQPCSGEITPAPQDQCGDNIDNNCDGQVDENCCPEGQSQPCYSGPPNTQGVGRCKAGFKTCTSGVWSICKGELGPELQEQCNNAIDDNCNGQVDEGCPGCQVGQSKSCYAADPTTLGVGQCRAGTQTCLPSGQWGTCEGQITPFPQELCNDQLDNNCNGQIDEGCQPGGSCTPGTSEPCYSAPGHTINVGPCKMGWKQCSPAGQWGLCVGEVIPQQELVGDRTDNNCNGQIDEISNQPPNTQPPNTQPPGVQTRWIARGSGCSSLHERSPAPLWSLGLCWLLVMMRRRASTHP